MSNPSTNPSETFSAPNSTETLSGAAPESAEIPQVGAANGDEAAETMRRLIEGCLGVETQRVLAALAEYRAVDRFKEAQLDQLHAELQGHRADLVGKATRPVFLSLIRLHDDIGKLLEPVAAEGLAALTPEKMVRLLEELHKDVAVVLEEHGVSAFRGEAERFDARREKVLRTVETTSTQLAGQVAERIRPGFEQNGVLLEKERVAVYVLPKNAGAAPSPNQKSDSP